MAKLLREEARFISALVEALKVGTPFPPEVEIEPVVGGFTVKNAEGFFVVTVKKAGPGQFKPHEW